MFNFQKKKKTTEDSESILVVRGILEKGYGVNPKLVWEDSRLTIESKAILQYLWSYTGQGGNVAFPSRDTILKHLNISKDRYYNHLNPLKEYGYIEVRPRPKHNGGFAGNIYILSQSVSVSDDGTGEEGHLEPHSLCSDHQDTIRPDDQNTIRPDDQDTNNNTEQYHINIPPNPPKGGKETRQEKREQATQEKREQILSVLNNAKLDNPHLVEAIKAWILSKEEAKKPVTVIQLEVLIKLVIKNIAKYGVESCIEAIETSVANGWAGIAWNIADKSARNNGGSPTTVPKKNRFNNFASRNRDYNELARLENEYIERKLLESPIEGERPKTQPKTSGLPLELQTYLDKVRSKGLRPSLS